MRLKDCALTNPLQYQVHILDVSRIMKEKAIELREQGVEIDPAEMEVIGYLHDIGKCISRFHKNGYDFHEYAGGRFLELQGHHREADIIRRHGDVEKMKLLTAEDLEGQIIDINDYIPNSVESKLLKEVENGMYYL